MVSIGMFDEADILTDHPTALKAMIAALQAENARMSFAGSLEPVA